MPKLYTENTIVILLYVFSASFHTIYLLDDSLCFVQVSYFQYPFGSNVHDR